MLARRTDSAKEGLEFARRNQPKSNGKILIYAAMMLTRLPLGLSELPVAVTRV
jgi:hypothetical protein